jgi:integrase
VNNWQADREDGVNKPKRRISMGVKVREKVKGSGIWWVFINLRGKRASKLVGSYKAARDFAKKAEEEITLRRFNIQTLDPARKTTFKKIAERWLVEHVKLKLKPSSQAYYKFVVSQRLEPEFGPREFSAITRSDIKAAVARWKEKGEAVRSIPNALRTLRSIFAWAIEEGLVHTNPCIHPSRIFKVDDAYVADFLTPREVEKYLGKMMDLYPRHFPFFRLLIYSGIRLGEAIALRWDNFDAAGGFLQITQTSWRGILGSPKSGKTRLVKLSAEMVDVLKGHRRRMAEESLKAGRKIPEWMFAEEANPQAEEGEGAEEVWRPMEERKLRTVHSAALKAAGLRHIRIHSLRATCGSLMVSAGVPIFHVAKALGHSNVTTTERHYAALAPGAGEDAPNVLERFISGKSAPPAHLGGAAETFADMVPQGNA